MTWLDALALIGGVWLIFGCLCWFVKLLTEEC